MRRTDLVTIANRSTRIISSTALSSASLDIEILQLRMHRTTSDSENSPNAAQVCSTLRTRARQSIESTEKGLFHHRSAVVLQACIPFCSCSPQGSIRGFTVVDSFCFVSLNILKPQHTPVTLSFGKCRNTRIPSTASFSIKSNCFAIISQFLKSKDQSQSYDCMALCNCSQEASQRPVYHEAHGTNQKHFSCLFPIRENASM
jgi:hypothetical protein